MEEAMRMTSLGLAVLLMAAGAPRAGAAAEIKVLTAGAFKQVVLALVPGFEKETGHKVKVENDTVGALTKRIEGGEGFDVAVLTPGAVNELAGKGKFVAGRSRRARPSPTSARSTPSRRRCWQPSPSPISIRRRAARAASMSRACSTSSASPPR
jgi:hypothetical protein